MEWFVRESRSGDLNVEIQQGNKSIFLHSRYNPLREASQLVGTLEVPIDTKEMIVIGMGAGYHVQQLANQYPNLQVTVLEFNYEYAKWSLTKLPLVRDLNKNKRIKYIFSEDLSKLKKMIDHCISDNSVELYIYKQSLELIKEPEVKILLKQIRLIKLSYANQKDKMKQNFLLNIKQSTQGLNNYCERLENKSIILVSAGPSLTKHLPLLKEAAESREVVIACVGTTLKLLLENKIVPQIVMISDANDAIVNQVDLKCAVDIPLFYLSTANHEAVKTYPGPKFIVLQEGYLPAVEYARQNEQPLISSGGSVATSLLDLVLFLGAKTVALVGQDLAFTGNQTHADNVNTNKVIKMTESLIEVDDFYKKTKVHTPLNLYSYKVWMEDYALRHKETAELWNCTEGGAFIHNWTNDSLKKYLEKFTSIYKDADLRNYLPLVSLRKNH